RACWQGSPSASSAASSSLGLATSPHSARRCGPGALRSPASSLPAVVTFRSTIKAASGWSSSWSSWSPLSRCSALPHSRIRLVEPSPLEAPHDFREVLERRLLLVQVAAQELHRRLLVLRRLLPRIEMDELKSILERHGTRKVSGDGLSDPEVAVLERTL